SLTIFFASSWAMPFWTLATCRTVSLAAGSGLEYLTILGESPRLISLFSKISRSCPSLNSSSEIRVTDSLSSSRDDLPPLKSKRLASSFWACCTALRSSSKSALQTMSKEESLEAIGSLSGQCRERGNVQRGKGEGTLRGRP